jgi:uncharacterized protein
MKCPRCGLAARASIPRCHGCGFSLDSLDRSLGDPPARATPLSDGAGLLSEAERGALTARISEWSERSGGEIVVVTLATTLPARPSEYAFWLFNRWDLAAPHRRGALLLLALHEQRIEIEAGVGWEDALSDLATGAALDRHVLPLLRERDYATALAAAVDALGALVAPDAPRTGSAR